MHNDRFTVFSASLPPLCAIFGSLMIAYPMEMYGRRMTLATISVPYVLGFYLMGLSYYMDWAPLLFIGRIITGLITGASAPTSQIYVVNFPTTKISSNYPLIMVNSFYTGE